jgi:hypothetical protein
LVLLDAWVSVSSSSPKPSVSKDGREVFPISVCQLGLYQVLKSKMNKHVR